MNRHHAVWQENARETKDGLDKREDDAEGAYIQVQDIDILNFAWCSFTKPVMQPLK